MDRFSQFAKATNQVPAQGFQETEAVKENWLVGLLNPAIKDMQRAKYYKLFKEREGGKKKVKCILEKNHLKGAKKQRESTQTIKMQPMLAKFQKLSIKELNQ